MLLCHASDWHGQVLDLPWSDLYLFTGDILREYSMGWETNPHRERAKQGEFVQGNNYRGLLGNPGAPVVVCKGNHDFVKLADLFGGEVYEISLDPTVAFEVLGYKFGGFRGVNVIEGSLWSDQMPREIQEDKASKLPNDLDFLITHSPPASILDGTYGNSFGMQALTNYINRQIYSGNKKLKAHFFGHVHESFGFTSRGDEENLDEVVWFSNAATGCHLYEFEGGVLSLKESKRVPRW